MNKRGLSQVVTIIILIFLVLVAIGIVWAAVRGLLANGANSISTGNLAVNMVIDSASYNSSSGIATVKVTRNKGISDVNITSLKFIVSDSQNSDSFVVNIPRGFPEYITRTYTLNISKSTILNLHDIQSIKVVPFYTTGSGTKELSSSGLSAYEFNTSGTQSSFNIQCHTASDCGTNGWIAGTNFCFNKTQVQQYYKNYSCFSLTCSFSSHIYVKENCASGETCNNGTCGVPPKACTTSNASVACGQSEFIGSATCQSSNLITQYYKQYDCINNLCATNTSNKIITNCSANNPPEVCSSQGTNVPQCFTPLQCTTNADCATNPNFGPAYVCKLGNCTLETPSINGTVDAPWPPGRNEYFQSKDLPNNASNATDYAGYTIIFPGSTQNQCLQIRDYVYPNSTAYDSYIRLNESQTNVSAGDQFQIWETSWGCTKI